MEIDKSPENMRIWSEAKKELHSLLLRKQAEYNDLPHELKADLKKPSYSTLIIDLVAFYNTKEPVKLSGTMYR